MPLLVLYICIQHYNFLFLFSGPTVVIFWFWFSKTLFLKLTILSFKLHNYIDIIEIWVQMETIFHSLILVDLQSKFVYISYELLS